jgi:hypothetical protein
MIEFPDLGYLVYMKICVEQRTVKVADLSVAFSQYFAKHIEKRFAIPA